MYSVRPAWSVRYVPREASERVATIAADCALAVALRPSIEAKAPTVATRAIRLS
jgi:hypothetical protein